MRLAATGPWMPIVSSGRNSFSVIHAMSLDQWLTLAVVLAEVFVGVVIYFELEQHRRVAFLDKATKEKAHEQRWRIYKAYFELRGAFESQREKSLAFMNKMLEGESLKIDRDEQMLEGESLKKDCDEQIALFNELGFAYTRRFFFFENPLVSILPHAAIYIFVILRPYIVQRRQDTGEWFARPLITFTLRCVRYVLKFEHGLHLRPMPGANGLGLSVKDLRDLRGELKRLLKTRNSEQS